MKFKFLEIEGFRTWHKAVFNLDRPGLTQIAGKNGSGKSSLIEALVWCLYGETLRNGTNIATKKTQRPVNWNGTKVSVVIQLVDGRLLKVTRYQDSKITGMTGHKSALIVEIEGEQIETVSKRDTQETLEQLLGLSFTAFSRAVVLPQRALSLLNAKPEHQREAIDALFDLAWLTEGKAKALADVQKYTAKVQEISTFISTLRIQINAIQSEIHVANLRNENIKAAHDSEVFRFKTQRDNLNNSLQSIKLKQVPEYDSTGLEESIIKLAELSAKVPVIESELMFNDREQGPITNSIYKLKADIEFNRKKFTEVSKGLYPSSICLTCGQFIDSEKIENQVKTAETLVNQLNIEYVNLQQELVEKQNEKIRLEGVATTKSDELHKLNYDINALQQFISDKKDNKRQFDEAVKYNASFDDYIQSIKNQLLDCENQLRMLESKTLVLESTTNLERELEQHNQQLKIEEENLEVNKRLYEMSSWWSVTGFGGRGGLRQYVVNQMLVSANEQIKKYAGTLGLTLNIKYDKTSIKVSVTDIDGIETTFEDLSGGEQQRLELMLTLTLHDIVNANSGVDLLFLDEPNTNVDDDGVFEVFEILRQKKGTIFIVTHTAVDGVGMNVVPVEKIGYESKILI